MDNLPADETLHTPPDINTPVPAPALDWNIAPDRSWDALGAPIPASQPSGTPQTFLPSARAQSTLVQEYTIETPENVTFLYEVAGIGSRFIGALVDVMIVGVLLVLLQMLLFYLIDTFGNPMVFWFGIDGDIGWVTGVLIALYFLIDFAIFWGYFLLFELLWNGQTPGKRLARTRVVQVNGEPAGFSAVAVRNLVRIVDFLPVAYAIGFVTMFLNDEARRLGDFAAGTLVIREQGAIALETIAGKPVNARKSSKFAANFEANPFGADLTKLAHGDIRLMRDVLQRESRQQITLEPMQRLAKAIATKCGVRPPPADRTNTRRFLTKLADAWDIQQSDTQSATDTKD